MHIRTSTICGMRGRHAGSKAVTPVRLTPSSSSGTNMRRTLVATNCLRCAAQQLFVMPKLQQEQQEQQQQQQQQFSLEELAVMQQQRLSAAASQTWQPAWAGAASSTCSRRATARSQSTGFFSMQSDAQSPSSGSASDITSHSSSSSSSSSRPSMPVTNGMPPLADLLGEAAAGDTPSTHPSSRSLCQSPDGIPDKHNQQQQPEHSADSQESAGVRAALAMLRWYKGALSPLMVSTCRFLPTCSQYSMDSYRAYGVAKGTVLTAWRLLRCNPWGLSGYDPTAWPPVGLAWLFRVEGSAEVAVVVGLATFLRLSHALLFE